MAKSKAKPASKRTDEIARATDQVRELQLRVSDVMNLCNMAVAAACSEYRHDDETTKGSMQVAARELDAIWRGLDIAATALEVAHG